MEWALCGILEFFGWQNKSGEMHTQLRTHHIIFYE